MRILLFIVLIAGFFLATEARTRFRRQQLPRDLYECVKTSCLLTSQYDPVCGSDGLTYETMAKLDCARLYCNRDVTWARRGACQ